LGVIFEGAARVSKRCFGGVDGLLVHNIRMNKAQ
jgi:hypothetical protein